MRDDELGKRLRAARTAKGLTGPQLAEKIGRTKTSVYRYEYGLQQPTLEVACDLANALDISLDHLVLGR